MRSCINTSIGFITIAEENGRIIGLSFGRCNDRDSNGTLDTAFSQLNEYLSGKREKFDLEYSLEGTRFQKKVWNALTDIPYGTTASYRDVARTIGEPNAFRAVGSANGRNPIPIFVPCHRVICSDGTIGGHSSGPEMKKELLRLEGAEWTTGKN